MIMNKLDAFIGMKVCVPFYNSYSTKERYKKFREGTILKLYSNFAIVDLGYYSETFRWSDILYSNDPLVKERMCFRE